VTEYRKIRAVNFSTLKAMADSPRAYRYAVQMPREDTPAMLMGRAVHCAVLEPDRFDDAFAIYTGARRAGKDWIAFKDEHAGLDILKPAERVTAMCIRDAVRDEPRAMRYLETGRAEIVLQWTSQHTQLKARLDWISGDGVLVELKTTRTIDPRRFFADATRRYYHAQLAWYNWGAGVCGNTITAVKMIVAQNQPPYDVAVWNAPDAVLARGEDEYLSWLDRLWECRERDEWPGVQEEETDFELPAWADSDDELTLKIGGEDHAL
jgi:hypothetical protein